MTTYYIDPEGGSDANTGLSFAQRWKSITKIGAGLTAGDEVRVMASSAPSLASSDTIWPTPSETVVNASVSGTSVSCSNSAPIVVSHSSHPFVTGDWVGISGDTGNKAANGIWKITVINANSYQLNNSTGNGTSASAKVVPMTNCVIETPTPLCKHIFGVRSAGVSKTTMAVSSNVTSVLTNNALSPTGFDHITLNFAAAFTTGKAAYYTLPATLDLSSFTTIAIRAMRTSTASGISLKLCSDSQGNTPVASFTLSERLPYAYFWGSLVFNNGAALPSGINSIAIYVDTDPGAAAHSLSIDHFIACNSVTPNSVVSYQSDPLDMNWFPVGILTETYIMLGSVSLNNKVASSLCLPYSGAVSGLQPLYSYGTHIAGMGFGDYYVDGTSAAIFKVTGGWSRNDMGSVTGETLLLLQGVGAALRAGKYNIIDRISAANAASAITYGVANGASRSYIAMRHILNINGPVVSLSPDSVDCEIRFGVLNFCAEGISVGSATVVNSIGIEKAVIRNCIGVAIYVYSGKNSLVQNISCKRIPRESSKQTVSVNSGGAIKFVSCDFDIDSPELPSLATAPVKVYHGLLDFESCNFSMPVSDFCNSFDSGNGGDLRFKNCSGITLGTVSSAATFGRTTPAYSYTTGKLAYTRLNSDTAANGTITSKLHTYMQSAEKHSGTSGWAVAVIDPEGVPEARPAKVPLGKIGAAGNLPITLSLRVKRADSNIHAALTVDESNYAAIAFQEAEAASTGVWELLQITITPSENFVVEPYLNIWGATSSMCYFDTFEIS